MFALLTMNISTTCEPNAKRQRTKQHRRNTRKNRVFSGGKRYHTWEQIKVDNAEDLFTKTIRNANDVRNAEFGLWAPDKRAGIRARTLLYVLVANEKHNVRGTSGTVMTVLK